MCKGEMCQLAESLGDLDNERYLDDLVGLLNGKIVVHISCKCYLWDM